MSDAFVRDWPGSTTAGRCGTPAPTRIRSSGCGLPSPRTTTSTVGCYDELGVLLEGAVPAHEDVLTWLAATGGDHEDIVNRHVAIYREHIRCHCPPA